MKKEYDVKYEGRPCYRIVLRDGFDELVDFIKDAEPDKYRKVCVVTDSNVEKYHLQAVLDALKGAFDFVCSYTIPAGEPSKNLDQVSDLYEFLIQNHFERNDLLAALGGGVIGDMTGFTAATYLRGIDFIQIPTSLLSQVDSSIGGKTGVDFRQYKNMVGAFYMPRLVYMNLSVLKTLPKDQFASGMGEIIKHGLIADRDYYEWLKSSREQIQALDIDYLADMVYKSCEIKGHVVEIDPKEKGLRATLNFGHTIGHAVEKLSDFRLFHGQCVAIGMAAASYLSMKRGNITEDEYKDILDTIRSYDLPVKTENLDPELVLKTTKNDKKMTAGHIKFILLEAVGRSKIDLTVTDQEMLDAIKSVM